MSDHLAVIDLSTVVIDPLNIITEALNASELGPPIEDHVLDENHAHAIRRWTTGLSVDKLETLVSEEQGGLVDSIKPHIGLWGVVVATRLSEAGHTICLTHKLVFEPFLQAYATAIEELVGKNRRLIIDRVMGRPLEAEAGIYTGLQTLPSQVMIDSGDMAPGQSLVFAADSTSSRLAAFAKYTSRLVCVNPNPVTGLSRSLANSATVLHWFDDSPHAVSVTTPDTEPVVLDMRHPPDQVELVELLGVASLLGTTV